MIAEGGREGGERRLIDLRGFPAGKEKGTTKKCLNMILQRSRDFIPAFEASAPK